MRACVVSGVQHDQDVRVARLPLARGDERSTTSRIWCVVTAATSAPGSRRTASSTAAEEVRPASGAATIEYGQQGTIGCLPSPLPKVWHNRASHNSKTWRVAGDGHRS